MGKSPSTQRLSQKLWRWFLAPSAQIAEQDKRRQASLLSAFLLGVIVIAILVELIAINLINWKEYTGYRQTFAGIVFLTIIYLLSRTRYFKFAAWLAVIITSLMTFVSGWAQPEGVLGGLLDFLILPLWLGSLYLTLRETIVLIILILLGLLLFPLTTSVVTLSHILIGPFSFIFTTSVLLIFITRHRNSLEGDRSRQLMEKEEHSRHEAAHTKALLRVAGRLNAQLDLDTLLETLTEETTYALDTPVAIVSLYEAEHNAINPIIGRGLSPQQIKSLPPYPKSNYDQTIKNRSAVFSIYDLQSIPANIFLNAFKQFNLYSMATATMEHERELIGTLIVFSRDEPRNFTEDELFLLKGIADQAALAIVNTRLFKDAQRRLKNLQALRTIDIAITTDHNLHETMDVLLENITQELSVDAAAILLLNESKQLLEFGASKGFQASSLKYFSLKVGEGMAGRAAQDRETNHVRDLTTDPKFLVNASLLANEGIVSYYAAPLITQGKVKGVLEVFHRSVLDPDEEWLQFLETLAGQTAIAIENASLFEDLQRTNEELSRAYDSTIEGWSYALDLRDKETEGHTRRVTELTLELAGKFDFTEEELLHIRRGGLLHDIGKMGVPDRILLKETPLEPDEWIQMKQHPVYAYEMLQPIKYLHEALNIPYCHHEKWDGTGYPRGLKGADIPLSARIFAIVDVWDAITSDRPYRDSWTREKALEHIQAESGKHFDPHVVEVFTQWIEQKNHEKI